MLDELPARIEANVVRGGVRAAAKVIQQEAKRLCPLGGSDLPKGHAPGDLRDSVRFSVRLRQGRVVASVKAGNAKAYYAHMVEFGTARHFIKPKIKKSLFFSGSGVQQVEHPGARAKPFMRPAIDNKARDAVDALSEYIVNRLPVEVGKLK